MVQMEQGRGEMPHAGRQGSQTKFIIGGAVIALVVIFLIFTSIGGSTAFYITISELKAQGAEGMGKTVRVTGIVQGDTIQYDERNLDLRFDLVDEGGRLSVMYHGVRPDMLQDGAEAVVEGQLRPGDTFEASELMLKCPSKYEEAATADATTQ